MQCYNTVRLVLNERASDTNQVPDPRLHKPLHSAKTPNTLYILTLIENMFVPYLDLALNPLFELCLYNTHTHTCTQRIMEFLLILVQSALFSQHGHWQCYEISQSLLGFCTNGLLAFFLFFFSPSDLSLNTDRFYSLSLSKPLLAYYDILLRYWLRS